MALKSLETASDGLLTTVGANSLVMAVRGLLSVVGGITTPKQGQGIYFLRTVGKLMNK